MKTKTKELPKNKVKKYIHLAKKNPIQAYLDLINLFLVVTVLGTLAAIYSWIVSTLQGSTTVNPIAFTIGSSQVYWYGICLALAIIGSIFYIVRRNRKIGIDPNQIAIMILWLIVIGSIAGRAVFIGMNWQHFSNYPNEIFNIYEGGISFFGALTAGFLFLALYAAVKKISLGKILDLFAPALLLGQCIGRWGSFFNQEYFGKPTEIFLKMYVAPTNIPWDYHAYSFFHPLFLYESLLCLIAFIILLIMRKKKLKSGSLFAYAVLFYSVIRFGLGFLGVGEKMLWSLDLAQIVSLIFAITSILILFLIKERKK